MPPSPHNPTLSLAGEWSFALDPQNLGITQQWFARSLPDTVTLPGTTDTNQKSCESPVEVDRRMKERAAPEDIHHLDRVLVDFSRTHEYIGPAWYQKEIEIPPTWQGKITRLLLERCLWETQVWVDDADLGTQNSLATPHIYDLTPLAPGRHRLTIRIDNTCLLPCGGHHLWSHQWNGIIGRLEITAHDPVTIEHLQTYPDLQHNRVRVVVTVKNRDAGHFNGTLGLAAQSPGLDHPACIRKEIPTSIPAREEIRLTADLSLGETRRYWSESSPDVYHLSAVLSDGDFQAEAATTFGMRELTTRENQLLVNGQAIFLRGTLECCVFPLTGHPPMEVDAWEHMISIAQSYGLNFFRFHLWCPPEAAFIAADRSGFYLQVELPGTSCPFGDEPPAVDAFLISELNRILATYGNHPSFCFLSMGNEQLIMDAITPYVPEYTVFMANHRRKLEARVAHARAVDPRHLYTGTSHPLEPARNDDYFQSAWPVNGPAGEPLTGILWGGGDVLHTSRFNTRLPDTDFDYNAGVVGVDRPVVTHEVGQWAIYPRFDEIAQYAGVLRARNFEIFRDDLQRKGMLAQAADFTYASGMLSLSLYKEEIESALRSSRIAGFQLLDLHDFPGQGTSTVGILDSTWNTKGLIAPEAFHQFCNAIVPLVRMKQRTWQADDVFSAAVEVAHYGQEALSPVEIAWRLTAPDGTVWRAGVLPVDAIPAGGVFPVGAITFPWRSIPAPSKAILAVSIANTPYQNQWDLWVYPAETPGLPSALPSPSDVQICTTWPAARSALETGACVLFTPSSDQIVGAVPGCYTPVFWNVLMKHEQISKTMGLLCDPTHPALAQFPTEGHSNWQWWDLIMHSCAMPVPFLPPAVRPILQVIDNPVQNRKLALLYSARVDNGRLVVCSIDIAHDLAQRMVARQFRASLLAYMNSAAFTPEWRTTLTDLDQIFIHR